MTGQDSPPRDRAARDWPPPDWAVRAELLQDSLERYFGARGSRLLNDWYPRSLGDRRFFNYWWLAHAIEARLDAYERAGEPSRLAQARALHDSLIKRNRRSLFNDYFDDMGWLGIAIARLADLTDGDDASRYAGEASALWRHVRDHGWNDAAGGGIAWRKTQVDYKNTPSNGTFIILGARLYRKTGESEYLDWALRAFGWLSTTLRRADGFILDGINRRRDGGVDADWRFTYNQGLYIGSCTELAAATGDSELIDRAFTTAWAGYAELATDGVLLDPGGDSGDAGLFKGVMYRYAAQLALAAGASHPGTERLVGLLTGGCDVLWRQALRADSLLAGHDWRVPPSGRVPLSAQLSAVIATEACARLAR